MSLVIDTKKNISLKFNSEFQSKIKKDSYKDLVNGTSVDGIDFRSATSCSLYSDKYNVHQQVNPWSSNKLSSRGAPTAQVNKPTPRPVINASQETPWSKNHSLAYRQDYYPKTA